MGDERGRLEASNALKGPKTVSKRVRSGQFLLALLYLYSIENSLEWKLIAGSRWNLLIKPKIRTLFETSFVGRYVHWYLSTAIFGGFYIDRKIISDKENTWSMASLINNTRINTSTLLVFPWFWSTKSWLTRPPYSYQQKNSWIFWHNITGYFNKYLLHRWRTSSQIFINYTSANSPTS